MEENKKPRLTAEQKKEVDNFYWTLHLAKIHLPDYDKAELESQQRKLAGVAR